MYWANKHVIKTKKLGFYSLPFYSTPFALPFPRRATKRLRLVNFTQTKNCLLVIFDLAFGNSFCLIVRGDPSILDDDSCSYLGGDSIIPARSAILQDWNMSLFVPLLRDKKRCQRLFFSFQNLHLKTQSEL